MQGVRSLPELEIEAMRNRKVAISIFAQIEENDLDKMIDNRQLVDIIHTYKKWYNEGLEPTGKELFYQEDQSPQ